MENQHVYVLDTATTTGKCNLRLWDTTDMKTLVITPIINWDNGANTSPNFKVKVTNLHVS
jgi:hypothetical protein